MIARTVAIKIATANAMKKRDPRYDPQVGDRLRDRNGQEHVVMPLPPGTELNLAAWRKYMRGATGLRTAQPIRRLV